LDNDLTNLTQNVYPNATPNPNDIPNPFKPGVAFGRNMVNQTAPREPGVAFGRNMVDKPKNHLSNAAPLRQITQIECEPEINLHR
jgi:hypothetical protein